MLSHLNNAERAKFIFDIESIISDKVKIDDKKDYKEDYKKDYKKDDKKDYGKDY